jgi:hypothetical protein
MLSRGCGLTFDSGTCLEELFTFETERIGPGMVRKFSRGVVRLGKSAVFTQRRKEEKAGTTNIIIKHRSIKMTRIYLTSHSPPMYSCVFVLMTRTSPTPGWRI